MTDFWLIKNMTLIPERGVFHNDWTTPIECTSPINQALKERNNIL